MNYKIKKGDKFLCLEDYLMDSGRVAYSKGKEYLSELDGRITDNENDTGHKMTVQDDFFDYFRVLDSAKMTTTSIKKGLKIVDVEYILTETQNSEKVTLTIKSILQIYAGNFKINKELSNTISITEKEIIDALKSEAVSISELKKTI